MANTMDRYVLVGCLLAGSLLAPLHADELGEPNSAAATAIPFGDGQVGSDGLAELRGGAVSNEQMLDGMVRDNQAYNLTTGGNLISEGAFAGSSGLATVIQNSGNNVLIQNSTIVNVQIK